MPCLHCPFASQFYLLSVNQSVFLPSSKFPVPRFPACSVSRRKEGQVAVGIRIPRHFFGLPVSRSPFPRRLGRHVGPLCPSFSRSAGPACDTWSSLLRKLRVREGPRVGVAAAFHAHAPARPVEAYRKAHRHRICTPWQRSLVLALCVSPRQARIEPSCKSTYVNGCKPSRSLARHEGTGHAPSFELSIVLLMAHICPGNRVVFVGTFKGYFRYAVERHR